jgi:hypothetical protein
LAETPVSSLASLRRVRSMLSVVRAICIRLCHKSAYGARDRRLALLLA